MKTLNGHLNFSNIVPRSTGEKKLSNFDYELTTFVTEECCALHVGMSVNIMRCHEMFGHVGLDHVKLAASSLDLKLCGEWENCVSCVEGKAKKKNLKQKWASDSKKVSDRLYIDLIYIDGTCYGGKRYWNLTVDDYSGEMWSTFLKKKSDLSDQYMIF